MSRPPPPPQGYPPYNGPPRSGFYQTNNFHNGQNQIYPNGDQHGQSFSYSSASPNSHHPQTSSSQQSSYQPQLPYQPPIYPTGPGGQFQDPSTFRWPLPSFYNNQNQHSFPPPPLPSHLHPSNQNQIPNLNSSRHSSNPRDPRSRPTSPSNSRPPKLATEESIQDLIENYLFTSSEIRKDLDLESNLVIFYGLGEGVTAENLARSVSLCSTSIEKSLVRTWLVRNRTGIPNAPILQDETLRSSNPKNSGSTTSTPLGPSLKFGFASFDTTTSAAAFLQHIKSQNGKNSLDLNPEPKIEIANPPETFVRLDPTDKSETENLKYSWNGIGKRGWDGISNGFGNEITKWCLKDDRIGADVWSKEDKVGFEKSESSNSGTKEKAIPRAKGWEIEDDEDKIVGDGEKNEKSVSDSRKGSEESASRKRQRVEGEFNLEDSNSDLKNQISERSKKVPQLAGSKKVALEISKWQTKQVELHQDPADPEPLANSASSALSDTNTSIAVPAFIPTNYDFSDMEKLACLLCRRQFKTKEVLRKHELESELHKKNLSDEEIRLTAAKSKASTLEARSKAARNSKSAFSQAQSEKNSSVGKGFAPISSSTSTSELSRADSNPSTGFSIDTTTSTSQYRDRALERRSVFGSDKNNPSTSSQKEDHKKRKVFDGPTPLVSYESETSDQISSDNKIDEEIQPENVGAKMLGLMGWTKGKGLGSEMNGRSEPVDSGVHRMGAGIGSGRSGSEEDGKDGNRGGGGKGPRKFEKNYLDAMRESAMRRFEEK